MNDNDEDQGEPDRDEPAERLQEPGSDDLMSAEALERAQNSAPVIESERPPS